MLFSWFRIFLMLIGSAILWTCAAPVAPPPEKTPLPPPDIPRIGKAPAPSPVRAAPPLAVSHLNQLATMDIKSGAYAAAFDKLERAIRIDPADPLAWHLLARVQLKQNDPTQAEQLARKSNLLIIDNPALEKQNWKIIAEALDRKGLTRQARQARARSR